MKHAVRKHRRRRTRPTNTGDSSSTVTIALDTPYLTPADVVAYLRGAVTVGTLANWRSKGKGPKPHKVGVKSLYLRREVDEFVLQQQEGAAAPPA